MNTLFHEFQFFFKIAFTFGLPLAQQLTSLIGSFSHAVWDKHEIEKPEVMEEMKEKPKSSVLPNSGKRLSSLFQGKIDSTEVDRAMKLLVNEFNKKVNFGIPPCFSNIFSLF